MTQRQLIVHHCRLSFKVSQWLVQRWAGSRPADSIKLTSWPQRHRVAARSNDSICCICPPLSSTPRSCKFLEFIKYHPHPKRKLLNSFLICYVRVAADFVVVVVKMTNKGIKVYGHNCPLAYIAIQTGGEKLQFIPLKGLFLLRGNFFFKAWNPFL